MVEAKEVMSPVRVSEMLQYDCCAHRMRLRTEPIDVLCDESIDLISPSQALRAKTFDGINPKACRAPKG